MSECVNAIECCDPSPFPPITNRGNTPVYGVTCNAMNDFGVWFEGAPVLCASGDPDFKLWIDGAPFVEQSSTY